MHARSAGRDDIYERGTTLCYQQRRPPSYCKGHARLGERGSLVPCTVGYVGAVHARKCPRHHCHWPAKTCSASNDCETTGNTGREFRGGKKESTKPCILGWLIGCGTCQPLKKKKNKNTTPPNVRRELARTTHTLETKTTTHLPSPVAQVAIGACIFFFF